ncbi:hypothetical protein Ancab_025835 [Ancistrocladus abbreviatus]
MAKRGALFVLWIALAVVMAVDRCRADESMAAKVESAKESASNAMHHAKENAESWTHWAYNKLSETWGRKSEDAKEAAHEVKDKASDAGSKIAQACLSVSDSMSQGVDLAKQKFGDSYPTVGDRMDHEGRENYEASKEKGSQAMGDIGSEMRKGTPEL